MRIREGVSERVLAMMRRMSEEEEVRKADSMSLSRN